jgi:hypothetical protein
MKSQSILAKEAVGHLLCLARKQIEEKDQMEPMLYTANDNGTTHSVSLTLPDQDVGHYFYSLGRSFMNIHWIPVEAVVVFQSTLFYGFCPLTSKPVFRGEFSRVETLVAVGRSAKTRGITEVVQPFKRDEQNFPVWQPIISAHYSDDPGVYSSTYVWTIDMLFEGMVPWYS